MEYKDGDYVLGKELNVIYDDGIDEDTKNRLEEAAELKNIEVKEAEQAKKGATNVYVGVHGQDGAAEDYITEAYNRKLLCLKRQILTFWQVMRMSFQCLEKNTDSAFYGLTTLYHILHRWIV